MTTQTTEQQMLLAMNEKVLFLTAKRKFNFPPGWRLLLLAAILVENAVF